MKYIKMPRVKFNVSTSVPLLASNFALLGLFCVAVPVAFGFLLKLAMFQTRDKTVRLWKYPWCIRIFELSVKVKNTRISETVIVIQNTALVINHVQLTFMLSLHTLPRSFAVVLLTQFSLRLEHDKLTTEGRSLTFSGLVVY